jgi:pimeloyl-ACP methyl ester carboxylesterase
MIVNPRTVAMGMMLLGVIGCATAPAVAQRSSRTSREDTGDAYGRTYYIDGAGNWGYGVHEVSQGLRRAGYRGKVINWRWSPTLNPALDQTVGRPFARNRGKDLARDIMQYLREYPDNEVSIIALSAGTGVAIWACEALESPAKVHNLVLLGSSLSSNYDVSKALKNISGEIHVYYSHGDQILRGPVRALGTIDGKLGIDGAGLVGLRPQNGSDRIHNIPWSPRYERYGWTGAHTDGTSEPFVRQILSQHVLPTATVKEKAAPADESPSLTRKQPATQPADESAHTSVSPAPSRTIHAAAIGH